MSDYELTDETVEVCGRILHRIRALRDINEDVHAGDLGGFVESTANLDASCGAWVFDRACVFDRARVYDRGWVSDRAWVFDRARVGGDAWVDGRAEVCEGES